MLKASSRGSYSRFQSDFSDSDRESQPVSPLTGLMGREMKAVGGGKARRESRLTGSPTNSRSWPGANFFSASPSAQLYSPTGSTPHFRTFGASGLNVFGRRGGRWRWLRHPLVRPLLQLPAEAFAGLIFWTLHVEFLHCIWWFQLKKSGVAAELFFLIYLLLPAAVLGHRFPRNYLDEHPWSRALLLLGGIVGVGGQMDSSPIERLAFSGSGVGIMGVYVYEGVWAGTATRRRKAGFGLAGGLLLLQALQWAYGGRNPLVARWWGLTFLGIVPGIGVALLVLYEDLAEWEGEDLPGDAMEGGGGEMVELVEHDPTEVLSDDWDQMELGPADESLYDGGDLSSSAGPSRRESEKLREGVLRASISSLPSNSARAGGVGGDEASEASISSPHVPVIVHTTSALSPGSTPPPFRANARTPPLMPGSAASGMRRWGEGEEEPSSRERERNGVQDDGYDSELDLPYVNREGRWKWTRSGSVRSCQMAVGVGSLMFLTHWLLTTPTVTSRWLGISTWWGILYMASLALGVGVAAEVARKILPKRIHGILSWLVGAMGSMWMAWGRKAPAVGGCLLAFAAPSLWVVMSRNVFGVYTGLGLSLSAVVYVLFILWSAALVAFQEMPGGSVLRGSDHVLMGVALLGVGVGLVRGPEVTVEERREFGSRLGAWRLGRLTWGSGVPDRQAVGALAAVVATVVAFALIGREVAPVRDVAGGVEGGLRVMSFNVYQGFNRKGGINFDAVETIIQQQRPHVVMLQEVDLMRIIHGNQDMVEYLSTWLSMHSLYTPPTRADTWGCAMLSVFPFTLNSWEALPSPAGENGCFQHSAVSVKGKTVHLMNAHFGDLGGDVDIQSQRVASLVRGVIGEDSPDAQTPLVLGGDFNLRPLSPAYSTLLSAGMNDTRVAIMGPWMGGWERDPGAGYMFVSAALNTTLYEEPHYDQDKTADGYPIIVSLRVR